MKLIILIIMLVLISSTVLAISFNDLFESNEYNLSDLKARINETNQDPKTTEFFKALPWRIIGIKTESREFKVHINKDGYIIDITSGRAKFFQIKFTTTEENIKEALHCRDSECTRKCLSRFKTFWFFDKSRLYDALVII